MTTAGANGTDRRRQECPDLCCDGKAIAAADSVLRPATSHDYGRNITQRSVQTGHLASGAALILAHNHPSGDPEPSADDFALTRRLASAGRLFGIQVLDHLVIGEAGRFVSLKERNVSDSSLARELGASE
jgi:hypothetical protein